MPRSMKGLLIEKIPLFALAMVSSLVTFAAQCLAIHTWEQRSLAARAANAVMAYVAYLGKLVCPTGLAAMYPLPKAPLRPAGKWPLPHPCSWRFPRPVSSQGENVLTCLLAGCGTSRH